ncbi:MAG: signal recognition particle protein, partial [Caldimonas sp.]
VMDPVTRAKGAVAEATTLGFDAVIVDTAGRLHIDDELMAELVAIKNTTEPSDLLFVADAMTGQDAIKSAGEFNAQVGVTGVVLTKMDGDARGGAALSVRSVTGVPIKFAGVSEKLDGLEVFDAQRHAGRVLGMGDIVGLVEEVHKGVDLAAAQKLADKVRAGDGFDLNDFLAQLSQMKKMGGLAGLMDKLPSQLTGKAANMAPADMDRAERDVRRMEGIICSMTPLERRKPELLKATRKRRIAGGAGVQVQEVNRLLNQFEQMRGMMKKMKGGGMVKMMKRMGGMKALGGMGGPR